MDKALKAEPEASLEERRAEMTAHQKALDATMKARTTAEAKQRSGAHDRSTHAGPRSSIGALERNPGEG